MSIGSVEDEGKVGPEHIQEVLAYLAPLLQGGFQPTESLLSSLQETDGGWGHCMFMEILKSRTTKELRDVVRQSSLKMNR